MDKYKETLFLIDSGNFDQNQLIQIIELSANNLNINTINGMAKQEGKSFNGIKHSNQYYKFNIGNCKLAVKGVRNDKLPF